MMTNQGFWAVIVYATPLTTFDLSLHHLHHTLYASLPLFSLSLSQVTSRSNLDHVESGQSVLDPPLYLPPLRVNNRQIYVPPHTLLGHLSDYTWLLRVIPYDESPYFCSKVGTRRIPIKEETHQDHPPSFVA
jgi:hypothetical protein